MGFFSFSLLRLESLDDQIIDGERLFVLVFSHVIVNEVLVIPRLLGLIIPVAEVVMEVIVLLAVLVSIVVVIVVDDHSAEVFIVVFLFLLLLISFVVFVFIVTVMVLVLFVLILPVVHFLIVGLGLSCL